jgi:hypothetical protein
MQKSIRTTTNPIYPSGEKNFRFYSAFNLQPSILVFGFCLILNLLSLLFHPFDGLYGQDSYSYYAHSVELHQNFSLFHHWQWEDKPRLLYWPVGYPLVASLFFKVGGTAPAVAQLVSLLGWGGVAALTADLTHRIATPLFPNKTLSYLAASTAGLLVSLSPLGRQAAVTVMADAATLFWTALAIWLAYTSHESSSGWRLIVCGFALGFACITRYFALGAFPVILLCLLLRKPGKKSGLISLLSPLCTPFSLIGALALGLVCLPQIIINLIYPDPLWGNSWLADWSPANWFRTAFATRDGFATYQLSPLLFNLFGILISPRFLTSALIPLLIFGFMVLLKQRQIFTLLLILSWWLIPVLFLAGLPYENERYSLSFLPPLALTAGVGTAWLIKLFSSRKWLAVLALAGLLICFFGLGWLSQRHLNGFIAVKQADLAIVREVDKSLPANAKLITFSLSLTFDRYTTISTYDLYFTDQTRLTRLLSSKGETYLLVDTENMQNQWANHFVGENYRQAYAFAKNPPFAQFGKYQLWFLANS